MLWKWRSQCWCVSLDSRLSVTFICCSLVILLDCINLIKHHKSNFQQCEDLMSLPHVIISCKREQPRQTRVTDCWSHNGFGFNARLCPREGWLSRCLTVLLYQPDHRRKCLTGCWNWKSQRPTQVSWSIVSQRPRHDQRGGFYTMNTVCFLVT